VPFGTFVAKLIVTPVAALPRNLQLDLSTVSAMVRIYCRAHHADASGGLCPACAELTRYAEMRLATCPFGEEKTTCRECPVHCYRAGEREAMRVVMRYAGPRMLWRHPLLAIRHLWLERQGAPPWPPKRRGH
jgi:Nitrous oxide-stimulated promoter